MDNIHWFGNYVIAATYYLPAYEILPGGQKFYRSQKSQDEALWQGKVGLSLARGRWPLSMTTATSSMVRT